MVAATDDDCKTSSLKPKFKEDLSVLFCFLIYWLQGVVLPQLKGRGGTEEQGALLGDKGRHSFQLLSNYFYSCSSAPELRCATSTWTGSQGSCNKG